MTPETPPAPTVTHKLGCPMLDMRFTNPPCTCSPNAAQAEAVVTEGDREAALSVAEQPFGVRWTNGLGYSDRYFIKRGQADDHPLVQAFARHRLSALRQHQSEVEALRGEVSRLTGRQRVSLVDQDGNEVGFHHINHAELMREEVWRDDNGTIWSRPTAWAYYAACQDRNARATKAEAGNAGLCKLIDAVQEEYWLRTGNADLDDLMNDLRRARDAQG